MLSKHVGLFAVLASVGLMASPSAQAQCVECATQMLNSTIQSNITQGIYDDMNRQNRQRDEERQRNATAGTGTAASASIEDRVMDAVMAPLLPEANRRVARDGKASAEAWYVAAARELGGQAGSLMPEYRRRVAADGQANADSWYVAAADELSRRYIQSGH